MLGLIAGKIVHYVKENGKHMGAITVSVKDQDAGTVSLQVFEDMNGVEYISSAGYSEDHTAGTWHWIEQEVVSTVEPTPETDQTS